MEELISNYFSHMNLTKMKQDEWLEADGLGGFASGAVSGIGAPRYHALLLPASWHSYLRDRIEKETRPSRM